MKSWIYSYKPQIDGEDDLIIGAPGNIYTNNNAGQAYVICGEVFEW
ncbi:MAG: hypothetical protein MRQ11_03145 [Candidatus Midichloria mitochondrii]|nr:hypothetical protein [Candidatus Midichloria mitochondrii]MDJ1298938.1 hypothetical protein [Candidatus Midichloria mitochondrii]MDJ1313130.1 hypothetical protein [Candidatus Midichloria mitochondrii]MDJ1583675.1 hypothetical protein [Candidatus Midichloria mitochondrii]